MSSPKTGILSLIRFDLGQNWDVYDRSYRVEPEAMVSEPQSMTTVIGWSQQIFCQS